VAFLEALNAVDLGVFIAGQDFAATQSFDEEFNQEVSYQGALGSDVAVLRSVRHADEDRITFTAVLLKRGVARGLNGVKELRKLRDFEVMTRVGDDRTVYTNCNWTRITRSSGQNQVTLTCEISVPGGVNF
jgi:hypothetical protein